MINLKKKYMDSFSIMIIVVQMGIIDMSNQMSLVYFIFYYFMIKNRFIFIR